MRVHVGPSLAARASPARLWRAGMQVRVLRNGRGSSLAGRLPLARLWALGRWPLPVRETCSRDLLVYGHRGLNCKRNFPSAAGQDKLTIRQKQDPTRPRS
jgi:hypothetical protein